MRDEDKKYVWWGLLGIGVAALFYFLSSSKKSSADTVTVPYLVPQTMGNSSSPSSGPSLSNQPNVIGASPNSTIPNFSNPYSSNMNPFETPGSWGFMPNLTVSGANGPFNNVQYGGFQQPPGAINFQNSLAQPGANYQLTGSQ